MFGSEQLYRMSPSEVRLISYFRRLNPEAQQTIERLVKCTSEQPPPLRSNVVPLLKAIG